MASKLRAKSILLLGDAKSFPFEHRMLNATNLVAGLIMLCAAPMNWSLGLGAELTLFCLVNSFIALSLYWFCRVKGIYRGVVPWTIANIFLSSILGFFINGGSHGGIQYYFFLSIIASTLLAKPNQRALVAVLFLVGISIALFVENHYPWSIHGYPNESQRLIDVWISFVTAGAAVALTVGILFDNFRLFKGLLLAQKRRGDALIRNTMPRKVANRLLQGERGISEAYPNVSVIFADIVGFSSLTANLDPKDFVPTLDALFQRFDGLTHRLGLEKVKTIGDAYMAVAGIPGTRSDHADACCELGLGMIHIASMMHLNGKPIELRIGLDSGPVVAGVIGTTRMHYDLWGNTVNVASRLQSLGEPGCIHLSEASKQQLSPQFSPVSCGTISVKGLKAMETWQLH